MKFDGVLFGIFIFAIGLMFVLIGRFAALRRKTFYHAVGVCESSKKNGKRYEHSFRYKHDGLEHVTYSRNDPTALKPRQKYNILVNPANTKEALLEENYKSMNFMDRIGLVCLLTAIIIFAVFFMLR